MLCIKAAQDKIVYTVFSFSFCVFHTRIQFDSQFFLAFVHFIRIAFFYETRLIKYFSLKKEWFEEKIEIIKMW